MRILQVTLGFYPSQAWGGPIKIVHGNSRELIKRGHDVNVYCTNLLNKKQKIKTGTFEQIIDGIRIVYIDTLNLRWWPGTLGPIWLPDLRGLLKREINNFDVIHINGYRSPMMALVAKAGRKAGIPIVTQPHGTLPVIVNSFWVKRIYDRFFGQMELEGISALIALQEAERQQALDHGIPNNIIKIIPNGIDLHDKDGILEQGSFVHRFNLSSDKQIILFLGRINKKKGTDMLIRAFAQMNNKSAQLIIAGPDDGQLAEVKELINKYNLSDRVVLPGILSGPDVLAAFQDSDLFVLPCRFDTFPVTIMESCLSGTPMVITDRCEIAHLVQGRVADVVPFDAGEFAMAMEKLLTDRERYERYQANCQVILNDTFSIKVTVDKLEALYENVVSESKLT